MANGVGDDIGGVEEAEEPEVDARCARSDEAADEGEGAEAEVADIDEGGHGEEAEHLAVGVHDAGDEVERVDGQEENCKAEGGLLDDSEARVHGDHRITGGVW